ncbi:unnamed protein product [Linum tenue]|uniref:Long-chain-fatty-acid--CoA ligase n=1 Tax=Linum tenue TaxID=586396 RepID=A0AAV0MKS8_9ROSI|nr:unnamed protein product [Linum tenue]
MAMEYLVKVGEAEDSSIGRGEGKPSAGPVYRSIYAKDGLLELPSHLHSPWQFFSDSAAKYANNPMLGRRKIIDSKAGSYAWLTYNQVYDSALRIGSAMRSLGVNPGDRCGIYGSNSPQWITAMEACNSQAVTYVPLYDTLGANAVEFIINHAEVSMAFVQENKLPAVLSCLSNCCSNLKTIISFGDISALQKKEAEELRVSCYSWEEFSQLGSLDSELPPKQKTDICTIMYTSGTTGEPKGVIITNGALMAEVLSVDHLLSQTDRVLDEEDTYFSFLPLAHIYDQVIANYCIHKGASIGFWQGDVRFLMEDLQELKPTMLCGVPRVYDRIYSGNKLGNLEKGIAQAKAAPFFDKLVFEKVLGNCKQTKLAFGGRVRILLSGAAPLPRHVEDFLRVISCSTLSQGYGLTESCGGCFTSIGDIYPMVGTVGVPMTTIEARLESVPEMGYDALASVPRGEICLRGNSLFSGYHKREDLTREVLVDGWFHTGDIGELQPNGAMKIIDRKKNIFKLSQGEYVAVENLENTYSRCPLVASIWVYGNSFESFLVAVVVPDKQAIEEWAKQHNVTGDYQALCENQKARNYVLDELNSTGKKHQLKGFEMLKGVHLEPVPFGIERDLVTPTFKLKRPQLLKYYKERVDQLYSEAKESKA